MKLIVLTKKDVFDETQKLAKKIKKDFVPDYIIFVEKGSLYIGQAMEQFFNVPLLSVSAVRKVNKFKKIIRPFLKLIPNKIKKRLREIELNTAIHETNSERNVCLNFEDDLNRKKVLLVDDSVDTGYTVLQIKKEILDKYSECDLKIASLNIFLKSQKNIQTDYWLYKDCMLSGPWSNDSKEYKIFEKDFKKYMKM